MNRFVSTSLLLLLLCHTLAYLLVFVGINWRENRDLSNRLSFYRSVDSLVEFYVPIPNDATEYDLPQASSSEGFVYNGTFYDVVGAEMTHDTLRIRGMANKIRSFWSQDLLGFLEEHIVGQSNETQRKAGHFLKNLLKEYCSFARPILPAKAVQWCEVDRFFPPFAVLTARSLPVLLPPPRA